MARVYKAFCFEIKIGIPTIWAQGAPSFRNKIAKMCYLYRRTGQTPTRKLHTKSIAVSGNGHTGISIYSLKLSSIPGMQVRFTSGS